MASLTDQLLLFGGDGDDVLTGDIGANVIHGDAGDDTLSGAGGADTLIGGLGDDLLFGGAGANVLYGGDGADILTYDSADANGDLQRLFGGEGANTLVLEFTQDDYLAPGVIDEVLSYASALAAGQDPGNGAEFVFQSFALRAASFSNVLIFVDGDPIAPGEIPGVDAVDDAFTVSESGSVAGDVTLNDNSPAGAVVSLLTAPPSGGLTIAADGAFTFSANGAFDALSAGDSATVTFTYRLTDDDDTSDATVQIVVSGENDAPTAGAAVADTDENQSVSGNLFVDSGAVDIDQNDVLTVLSINGLALNGAQRAITLPSGAVITVAPTGGYLYAPGAVFDSLASGATATEAISFVLADGRGGQVASSLTLTIDGQNDAPVANPDTAITTEDADVTIDVLANDADVDQGDVLTLVSIDSVTPGGSAVITPAGQILFQPGDAFDSLSAGASAFVEIAYTMQDASGARSASIATVTVTGVNDAPTATNVSDATTEDNNLTGNLLAEAVAADVDNADVLTISAINGVAFTGGGSAQIASGALLTVMANGDYTYAPSTGFNNLAVGDTARDSFTFTVSDGRGGQVTQTFSIDVTGENDGPVAQDIAISAAENGGASVDFIADSAANDPDDDAILSLAAVNGAAPDAQTPFFIGSNGGRLSQTLGAFSFDPFGAFEELSVGEAATTTFTFTIADDLGGSVTRTLTVQVQGENDAPTADTVAFLTDEDTAATGNLLSASLADDIDRNDTLSVTEILADGLADGALNGAQRAFTLVSGAVLTVAPDGAFSFQPAPQDQALAEGDLRVESFAFRISDGQGGEKVVSVEATIDGLNDGPAASAINRGALEDLAVAGDLIADSGASDVDTGDVLRVTRVDGQTVGASGASISGADGGLLFIDGSGGYTFDPNGDFEFLSAGDTAVSTFTFRIEDSFGAFVERDIIFSVDGANDAPEADAIEEATNEDIAFTGNLIDDSSARDVDQNDVLTISQINADGLANGALNGAIRVFTLASGAQLTVSPDGAYTYDPLQAFQSLPEGGADEDAFSFVVVDGNGASAQESVTISIAGVNDVPTLDPITATTAENSQITGDLVVDSNAVDIDLGDTVRIFALEGQDFSAGTVTINRPGEGRMVAEGPGYRYDPLNDFDRLSVGDTAEVSYEFTVRDDFGATATTTITFTITGENDGPTAQDFADATTEDDALTGNLLDDSNALDVDENDTLTVSSFNAVGPGDVVLNGSFARVTLASGASLTVNPNGEYTLDPNGAFDALSPGQAVVEAFSFTLSDGQGGETTQTATITINGVNDAPVAENDVATTDQDTGVILDLLGNDSDVDGFFSLTSVTQPAGGGQVLTGSDVFFDPDGEFDFLGLGEQATTTFSYTITDDLGATDAATVIVTVTGLNDAPVANPLTATTDEDRAAFTFDLLTNQFDIDQSDVLSVENFVEAGGTGFAGFTITGSTFTFDARQFDFLEAGDQQVIVYDYDIVDLAGARAANRLTLTVEGRDETLAANDDTYVTDEDTILSDDVSLNDTIGTGSFFLDQDVGAGLLTLNADGTFTFDPNGEFDALADGEQGGVMFTYFIDDGVQNVMATATIDILGVNDGPEADAVSLFTDEDTGFFANLINESNASDPDATGPIELDELDGVFMPLNGDDVFFTLSSGVSIQANRAGEIVYDPSGFFDELSDGDLAFETFTFALVDDFGDGVTVDAEIQIVGVNDPVEASNASFTADEDAGTSNDLIDLSNAVDVDLNDQILIGDVDGVDVMGGATITLGSGALLAIDEFGSFNYDTNGQFEGLAANETDLESFDYTITDGFSSVDLTAAITIEGVNDAVVIDTAASDLSGTFTAPVATGGASVIDAATLNGANGFALFGEAANIEAGAAVAGGGDFDGDGFLDIVVGSPGYTGFYTTSGGSAFVLFGNGASPEPSSRDIPNIQPDFDGLNFLGGGDERVGTVSAFVGDVNGDGFDDFLIGNGYAQPGQSGVARLVFSQAPTSFGYQYLDATTSTTFFDSSTAYDGTRNLGYSVASAGDVNNDGVNDFIIGAPFTYSMLGDQDFGKAYVVYGRAAGFGAFGESFDLATLDGIDGFRIDDGFTYQGTQLGRSVSGVGDVNGDGIDDIFVGAPGTSQSVSTGPGEYTTYTTGAGYIIFGTDDAFDASFDVLSIDSTTGVVITDPYSDTSVGLGVSGVGDFNGDGLDDFIVGTAYDGTGVYAGAAYLIFGSASLASAPVVLGELAPREGFQIIGAEAFDYVGRSLAAAGDVNGDGLADVIIGAQSNYEGFYIGEAYILFGTSQSFTSPLNLANFDADDGIKLNGFDTGDVFGGQVSGAGDLNEDGFDDVVVGARGANNTGAAFVFFGSAGGGGGGGPVGGTGSVFFDDVDLSDAHITDVTELNNDDDDVSVTFDLITDSTGGFTGEAEWAATIDRTRFDQLAEGQTFDESFDLTVDDENGGADTVRLDLSFVGVNDAPTSEDVSRTTDEDVLLADGDLFVEGNVMDVDEGDTLRIASIIINVDSGEQTFALTATPTLIDINGAALLIDETGQYSVEPSGSFDFLDDGETGNVSFDFVVADQGGLTSRSSAVVAITGANDAPTAVDDAVSTDQDTVAPLNLFANDIDPEGGLSIRSLDTSSISGSVVIENASTGQVVYNPNGAFDFLDEGEQRTDTFSYVLEDSGGLTSTADVTVTVTGLNDAPIASDVSVATSEDDTVAGNFLLDGGGLDVDQNDVLVVRAIDGVAVTGANQTINLASGSRLLISPDGQFTYDPFFGTLQSLAEGVMADDVIAFEISDGDLTATANLVVTVTGVNDAPTATPLSRTTNEDEPAFAIDLLANAVEIDQGDALTVENFLETPTNFMSFTLTGTDLIYDATIFDGLAAGQSQIIDFTYDIVDSEGARVATTLQLTIEGRDEGLLAVDDSFSTNEDTPISGDVSVNDVDQGAVFSLVTNPQGDIVFNADGTFDYDGGLAFNFLSEGEQSTDSFTYQIDDGVDQVTAEVTITIDGVNDAPAIFVPIVTSIRLVTEDQTDAEGGDSQSLEPALSGDGDTVTFNSNASNLISGDTNARTDVYFEDPSETVDRASIQNGTNNQTTTDGSSTSEVNHDGSIIVFQSRASDLVPTDAGGAPVPNNNVIDIYVRDTVLGETQLLIQNGVDGQRLNGDSLNPSVSANGRFVVFQSAATNVAENDTNNATEDVYLHDRQTGETINVREFLILDVERSFNPVISADGGTVVFLTSQAHDAADTNGLVDVYAFDVETSTLELVSRSTSGDVGNQAAFSALLGTAVSTPSVSANGRYVSWVSSASDLVGGDGNGADDIFVHDRFLGTTERVSVTFSGLEGDGASFDAKLSDNGRFVTFQTQATNLDDLFADTNADTDVYVKDRITGDLIRVTVPPDFSSQPGGGQPDISADGAKIAFASGTASGNFDDRVVTGNVNDIYVATIDTTGFNFGQSTPFAAAFVDLEFEWFDPDGIALEFSNIDVSSDNTDRIFSFSETTDGNGRVIGFNLDPGEFADLGANDYELLTAEYDITDGIESSSGVTAIVIVGENDAPTANDQTFDVNQGQSVSGSFFAMDIDGDALTFDFLASALQGDLVLNADGSFIYTSAADQGSDEIISINVRDGNGGLATFNAIFDVNQAPTFSPTNEIEVALTDDIVTSPMNSIDAGAFFSDPEGGALTFTAITRGFSTLRNGFSINANTGEITGTPNTSDLVRIEVTATDEVGLSTTGDFWLASVAEVVVGDSDGNNISDAPTTSFIDGLGGNDSITGDNNFDVYQYRRGEGFDIIDDTQSGGENRLVLTGYNSDEVQFTRFSANPFDVNGTDLLITPVGLPIDFTEGVLVRGALIPLAGAGELAFYHFDDGVILDEVFAMQQILERESTDGDDDIRGFAADNTLAGGLGDDFLTGGDANDLYIYNAGDGDDTIRDNGNRDTDIVQIGYTFADASFSQLIGTNTIVADFGGGDRLEIVATLLDGANGGIEVFRFLDGDFTMTDIRSDLINQQVTAGDDLILGFDTVGDTLEGGAGDDTLIGFGGVDTYIYRAGGGDDFIDERGFQGDDILRIFDFTIDFDAANGVVNPGSQATFSRGGESNDRAFANATLIIDLDDGAGNVGSVRLNNILDSSTRSGISSIEFVDAGVTLNMAQIRSDLLAQQVTAGDDTIIGFGSADTLRSGAGNDFLVGRDGTDIYEFAIGDGDDTVGENGFQDADRVSFIDRALADFDDIFYDAADNNSVVFVDGTDRIRVVQGLEGGNNQAISLFDFTDQTLSDLEMRQVVVDRALLSLGRDLLGGPGTQMLPSSPGSDRFVSGRNGSDTYIYAAGDGNDTIFDDSSGDTDVLDLTAFNSTDFNLAGPNSIRFDPAFSSNVQLFIDANNTLDILVMSAFEQVLFADATFDNDNDDADGATNFQAFIASLVSEAVTANPNEDVITKVEVADPGGNNTFTSTVANEYFNLDTSNGDEVIFNVGAIGNDSLTKGVGTRSRYDVTIDFSGLASPATVLEESVNLSFSRTDIDDLIIDVVFEDDGNPLVGGFGRIEERIVLNDALQAFNILRSLTIIDTQGQAGGFASTQAIIQQLLAQQVTSGNDKIFGLGFNDTLTAGAGNDTLNGGAASDRYEFFAGDQSLFVQESIATTPIDVVAIHGYSIDDSILSRSVFDTRDLVIDLPGEDRVTINEFFRNPTEIERVIFDAETATPDEYTIGRLTTAYLAQQASGGDDLLVGNSASNDTLNGGLGDDTLDGDAFSDTYIVNIGEGDDLIRDGGNGNTDVVQFNVASTDVTFEQNQLDTGNFFIVMSDGTRIEIAGFLDGNNGKIEQFAFTDITLDKTQARIRAFDDLATDGNDTISGGGANDTLRGGLGDDAINGNGGTDTFTYALGDGDDTLFTSNLSNDIEFIQISGVDVADIIFSRVQGSRDLRTGSSSDDEDYLITFASSPGSILVENGLVNAGLTNRIEIVDSGVTLTDQDIFNGVIATDVANGRKIIEGPSSGRAFFPAGGEFIFADSLGDLFQFAAGQGSLTILDVDPTDEIQRLEVLGYSSADATFSRLAAGAEDFIIRLPGGDQIIVIGEINGGSPVNGVNEIFFDGDNVTFNNSEITALLDGTIGTGPGAGGGGGGVVGSLPRQDDAVPDDGGAEASAEQGADLPSEDDVLVLTGADEVMRLGGGDDHVRGRGGDDALWGQSGDDTLYGDGGGDTLRGGADDDDLRGGGGRDKLFGGGGDDMLRGNGGRDTLKGAKGEDDLSGGAGRDILKGGGGDDRIDGGRGDDRLTGQGGEDAFVFELGFGSDVITDFRDGVDVLDFSSHGGVSALGDLAIAQSGADAVITDGVGGRIRLLGTDTDDLQADDFLF